MITLTKVCPRCKEKLLLSADNFYPCKDKKSGFRPHCISCCKLLAKTGWGKTSKEAKARKNYVRKYELSQRSNALLNSYKRRDKKNNQEFDLDKPFVVKMLSSKCAYCGDNYMPNLGLDRVDNFKGHIKSNVVTCCYECNTARSNNFSYEEMKEIGLIIKEIKLRRQLKMHSVKIPF